MSEGDERRVMTDEERARVVREQLKSLHAFDLAYEMMVSLISFGYQKLGLTGETAELRDLDDAHFAIELLGALLKVSDREHPVSDLRDLHSTLAQMQLGYVQALELEGRRPPQPVPAASAEPEAAAPAATPEETREATPDQAEEHLAEDAVAADEAEAGGEPAPEPAARTAAKKPAARRAGAKQTGAAAQKPAARRQAARKNPGQTPGTDAEG